MGVNFKHLPRFNCHQKCTIKLETLSSPAVISYVLSRLLVMKSGNTQDKKEILEICHKSVKNVFILVSFKHKQALILTVVYGKADPRLCMGHF